MFPQITFNRVKTWYFYTKKKDASWYEISNILSSCQMSNFTMFYMYISYFATSDWKELFIILNDLTVIHIISQMLTFKLIYETFGTNLKHL